MRGPALAFAAVLLLVACADDSAVGDTTPTTVPFSTAAPVELDLPATRPFAMGFTRWPYDFDQEAVDWTWQAIGRHGDVVAIHLDTGVPWDEAAAGEPFPDAVQADLEDAARRADAFDLRYVAVTPLHGDRATIAHYWNDAGTQQPPPPEWDGLPVDDPVVVDAYIEYCLRVIDILQPDWFAYGIEVNAGYRAGSPEHDAMLGLAERVYPALKSAHPDLPVFLTFQIGSWEAPEEEAFEIAESLLPWSDLTGIAAYPFLDFADPFRTDAEPAPVDESLARFADLGKPIGIGETGYIAESLVIPTLGFDMTSNVDWQADYIEDLLASAAQHDTTFVVYWEIRDYDQGYEFLLDLGADPELAAVWRDIGLFDGAGEPRPALAIWDAWLELARS